MSEEPTVSVELTEEDLLQLAIALHALSATGRDMAVFIPLYDKLIEATERFEEKENKP